MLLNAITSSLKRFLSIGALGLLAVAMLPAADKPTLPDGPGKAMTVKLCGTCHAAELLMGRRESREGWSGVVEDMIQRGAKGSDEDLGEVVDYLVTHFSKRSPAPKVNVNKAAANELVAGLALTEGQASAVIRYREEKGALNSIEDLLKVPGLNASAIESKKSRIEF